MLWTLCPILCNKWTFCRQHIGGENEHGHNAWESDKAVLKYHLHIFHQIFSFKNMLPTNAFIKVVLLFFFFKFGQESLLKSKVSKTLVPETGERIPLLLKLPLAYIFLLLEMPQHEFTCCSKNHSMSFLKEMIPVGLILTNQ